MSRLRPSLRLRLALGYCAALAGGLFLFGLLLFSLARFHMLRHYDGVLAARGDRVRRILESQAPKRDLRPAQMEALNQEGRLVVVKGSAKDGQLIYYWPEFSLLEIGHLVERMGAAGGTEPAYETLRVEGTRWRLYFMPLAFQDGGKGRLLMVEDLRDVQRMIRRLLLDYLLLAGLGMLISFFGSYWIAGRGLAPIERIAATAREIEATNLHRRLPDLGYDGEVGLLTDTLNRMFHRLEASFEAMKRFTADASHELRSPLATIRNTIDVTLAQPRPTEAYQAALGTLGEEVDRIRTLVEDLLLLARADAGRLPLSLAPVPLGELVEAQVEAHQFQAEDRAITLSLGEVLPDRVLGDERWLHQVVGNLLDNALKYTPEGGTVAVRMGQPGAEVLVQVVDSGPGIPEEDLGRIFERFYRADPSRSRTKVPGLGLGLAIAAWVVQEHGGTLRAENRPEGGAVFTLGLPRLQPPAGV